MTRVLIGAATAAEELARVRQGLAAAAPLEMLALLALLVASVTAVLVVYNRRRRKSHLFQGWVTITRNDRIAEVLERAAARGAFFTLEIFENNHTGLYRGKVDECQAGKGLWLQLSEPPDPAADFKEAPVQIHLNFRPSLKKPMEHYQFPARGIKVERGPDPWSAKVFISWPSAVVRAQRRDFIRLETVGSHAMEAGIFSLDDETLDVQTLSPADTAKVLDISVGGIQLMARGLISLRPEKAFLIKIELPLKDLDYVPPENALYLLVEPVAVEYMGLTPNHTQADPPPTRQSQSRKTQTRTIVRGRFIGRYKRDGAETLWRKIPFKITAFQDLAHWITAYQRFLLKKEKGLMAQPEERINLYPSIPPDREGTVEIPAQDQGEEGGLK